MPSTVRGEVGGTNERLAALRTAVLDVHNMYTAMLGQLESVVKELMTQAADVVAYLVFNLT